MTAASVRESIVLEGVRVHNLQDLSLEIPLNRLVVVTGISGSGNSENVLRAIRYANLSGCRTIALTSGESGQLRDEAQLALAVPSSHMGRLEDCFFIMTHVLCYAFIEDD